MCCILRVWTREGSGFGCMPDIYSSLSKARMTLANMFGNLQAVPARRKPRFRNKVKNNSFILLCLCFLFNKLKELTLFLWPKIKRTILALFSWPHLIIISLSFCILRSSLPFHVTQMTRQPREMWLKTELPHSPLCMNALVLCTLVEMRYSFLSLAHQSISVHSVDEKNKELDSWTLKAQLDYLCIITRPWLKVGDCWKLLSAKCQPVQVRWGFFFLF